MNRRTFVRAAALAAAGRAAAQTTAVVKSTPQYRPAFHFTPEQMWMNDPNGLVFHDGVWHLFYQHHPHSMVWGPMHWGHATSADLLHWQHEPIALHPDTLGMIFSGSIVIDTHDSAGFGRGAWVALFTHHDTKGAETPGNVDHQHQSLAVSLDRGRSWTKYAGNPVLRSPGVRDIRDPKVFWHAATGRWIMSLAVGDRIAFYSSPNLKAWTKESEFGGPGVGAHGGVWECPDLLRLHSADGAPPRWVLLVSLTPGGPNGGSATQYFVGDFDGRVFTPESTETRWLDYGPDNYAGVTWHNTGERAVFIGWMSNWEYAKDAPTAPWRSAMTLPRELTLRRVDGKTRVASLPAAEVANLGAKAGPRPVERRSVDGVLDLSAEWKTAQGRLVLSFAMPRLGGFELELGNAQGEKLVVGFDAKANQYFIDRRQAGLADFSPKFAGRHVAPRVASAAGSDAVLVFDATSVELFADGGLTAMTSLFFPRQPYASMVLKAAEGVVGVRVAAAA